MELSNEDVREVMVEMPEGHRHIRTRIRLADGSEIVFQEATMANIVRAFISVKTHPMTRSVRLTGRKIEDAKSGYASWQLLED